MKIVHASDWHGKWHSLPYADLYIFSGDMYPNSANLNFLPESKIRERKWQKRWAQENYLDPYLGNKDAKVICVRGNHDFEYLTHLFENKNVVNEIDHPEDVFEFQGKLIGGFRGINYMRGLWSDETWPQDFKPIIDLLPTNLDIIVSHTPPYGIRDQCLNNKYGCQEYLNFLNTNYIYGNKAPPQLLCFGHIHEDSDLTDMNIREHKVIISNAATTYNEIEL